MYFIQFETKFLSDKQIKDKTIVILNKNQTNFVLLIKIEKFIHKQK